MNMSFYIAFIAAADHQSADFSDGARWAGLVRRTGPVSQNSNIID
jgi:hypothetical protein